MKVAAVQHDIAWESPSANFERLAPRVDEAARAGARLVVLTEMFATGFSMNTAVTAEVAGGPTTAWLVERAAVTGVWIGGTLAQASGDGKPYNLFVVAGPDGTVHRYAKRHRFSPAGEHEHFVAGEELVTVEVEGLRITPFVCYDLRFADGFWATGPGTDLFVVPANWPAARHEHWATLLRARAIENQCYVLGVNRVGVDGGGIEYAGGSCLVDPLGRTRTEAGDGEDLLVDDVDPRFVADVRQRFPFLADRRTQEAQSSM